MNERDKNPHYDDCYFSESDGMAESHYVFIQGNDLPQRLANCESTFIGETGFGTGLNLLTLLGVIQNSCSSTIDLHYRSIEKYPLPFERIAELLSPFKERLSSLLPQYEEYWNDFYSQLKPGLNRAIWEFPMAIVHFDLYYGDAQQWILEKSTPTVEAWFLDGHSPKKNPDLWSPEIMGGVFSNTAPGGTIATFTAAGLVKRSLREAGFIIERTKGFGEKRHMIRGEKPSKSEQ